MRILGIDPGLATMGWGVLDSMGSKNQLVKAGAVITPPDMPIQRRLHSIFLGVKELIVDGEKFEGSVIPYDASRKGQTVKVTVVM